MTEFGICFSASLAPRKGTKIAPELIEKNIIMGSIFGTLLFEVLELFWVPLGSLLGAPEALLGGLWTPKT